MKKQWKGFVAGLLVAMLASSLLTPALGALAAKTIQVYTGVNVYVDDQLVQPKDANGNPVEVFVYNGTTYLPIRAVGEALGKPVQWEGKTSSAYVGKHQGDKPAVWLKDLDYFTGTKLAAYREKDNLGAEHNETLSGHFRNTYLLNGQYSAISGTLFQLYKERTDQEFASHLEIYGDGKLLYSAEMKGGVKPLDFYVSLVGVLELEIYFDGDSYWENRYAGVSDLGLWT